MSDKLKGSDKLKEKLKEKRLQGLTKLIKIGKQNVVPDKVVKEKRYNRYQEGQKVTVVAEVYRTGIITKVWIRHKQLTYTVKCGDGVILNKLPEEALLPHVSKRQYKFIKWLGRVCGINIITAD